MTISQGFEREKATLSWCVSLRPGAKLVHERCTAPWLLTNVVSQGLSMHERNLRRRAVPTSSIKTFHTRPPDLHHPMENEVPLQVRNSDLGLAAPSTVAAPLYTLIDRREDIDTPGTGKWEHRARHLDGDCRVGYQRLKYRTASLRYN